MGERAAENCLQKMIFHADSMKENWADHYGLATSKAMYKYSHDAINLAKRSAEVQDKCDSINRICLEILGEDAPKDKEKRLIKTLV